MTERYLKVIAGAPEKPMRIGGIEIQCYVLEDETRVITQRSLYSAVGVSRGGAIKKSAAADQRENEGISKDGIQREFDEAKVPRFAQQEWLRPYISPDLPGLTRNPCVNSHLFRWPCRWLPCDYSC